MPQQSRYCRRLIFTLASIVLYLGLIRLVSCIDCHCSNNNAACDQSNGFCASGCEKGWFGPGCQVGNLALGKAASQSSTINDPGRDNSAGKATDGLMPANASVQYCTQADQGQSQNPWWFVTLSDSEVFVLTKITLVNRQGIKDYRLANFYILYTNDTSSSTPSPDSWATCAYERDSLSGIIQKNYTCSPSVAIGRRVAVFTVSPRPETIENGKIIEDKILTLCEVYVYGYQLREECPAGYTGPGCLLRGYNSDLCRTTPDTTPGDFGGCNFRVCPKNAYLPPDCWKTMPSFKNVTWSAEATCDYIHITTQSLLSVGNLDATTIFVSVNPNDSFDSSRGQCFRYDPSKNLDIIIPTTSHQAYYVWLTPLICSLGIGSDSRSTGKCINITECQIGVSSPTKLLRTTSNRTYNIRSNGTCLFATFVKTNSSCSAPLSLSLSCDIASIRMTQDATTGTNVCGLSAGKNYTCTVLALLQDNLTETITTEVHILNENTTSPTMDVTSSVIPRLTPRVATTLDPLTASTLGGPMAIIAGSVTGAVSLVAITVGLVIYSLRQKLSPSGHRCTDYTSCNTPCVRQVTENRSHSSCKADDGTYFNTVDFAEPGNASEEPNMYASLQKSNGEPTYAMLNLS